MFPKLSGIVSQTVDFFHSFTDKINNKFGIGFRTPNFNSNTLSRGQVTALNSVAKNFNVSAPIRLRDDNPKPDNISAQADLILKKHEINLDPVGESNVWTSHDLPEIGKDVAQIAAKNPQVVDAVYDRLTPAMQSDVGRVLIDQLKPEDLKKLAATDDGKALLARTRELLDGKSTGTWFGKDFSKGDARRKNQIDAALNPQAETTIKTNSELEVQRPVTTESKPLAKLAPVYKDARTTAELNNRLLESIADLKSQPSGIKPHLIKKTGQMSPGGVSASESAAKSHSRQMPTNDLKAKFERLGEQYGVPPALIAGIASRESNMGAALRDGLQKDVGKRSIWYGWGDFGQRNGETGNSYHGFGIIQVDRKTAPLGINSKLEASFGKTQLDPYSEEHVGWGVQSFLKKLEEIRKSRPDLAEAEQIATAVSKYNGGIKGGVYPDNDRGTSGHDYANDTLVRARWYAQNWDKLK